MKHAVITAACGICLLSVCVGLAMPAGHINVPTSRTHAVFRQRSGDATTYLRTIGLPGDSLLAAGFSTSQVLSAGQSLLENAAQVDAFVAMRRQVEQLQQDRKQLADDTEADHAEAIQQIDAQLAPLKAQLASSRTALCGFVLSGASDEQRQSLQRIAIGRRHGLPLDLAVAVESDNAAIKLAAAVKSETRSARTGEAIPEAARSQLAVARARPDVVAAAANGANWTTIRQALGQTSTGDHGR